MIVTMTVPALSMIIWGRFHSLMAIVKVSTFTVWWIVVSIGIRARWGFPMTIYMWISMTIWILIWWPMIRRTEWVGLVVETRAVNWLHIPRWTSRIVIIGAIAIGDVIPDMNISRFMIRHCRAAHC